MTTTTSYGTWQTFTPGELSVRQGIEAALSSQLDEHDLDAIESDYREAINTKLKDTGIVLSGDEFTGPAEECGGCREAAPGYISEVLDLVSQEFYSIVRKHQKEI